MMHLHLLRSSRVSDEACLSTWEWTTGLSASIRASFKKKNLLYAVVDSCFCSLLFPLPTNLGVLNSRQF
jgi:hypothetical protein